MKGEKEKTVSEDIQGKGRYLTRGIDEELELGIQIEIWEILDKYKRKKLEEKRGDEIDYIQIFDLETKGDKLVIRHRQEEPDYKKEHQLDKPKRRRGKRYQGKIYIIDNEVEGMTMMWAEEY